MKFIPNACVKETMLNAIGVKTIDDLFEDIPQPLRAQPLSLPKGKTQQEVEHHLRQLAYANQSWSEHPHFLGGGIQPHYIPAVVQAITNRSEFYTAYTPYQPEASQGFLQAMFEYQSMIAELTGVNVANASLYDGMTALGEAALLCCRQTKRNVFIIPENISWEKQSILHNYVHGQNITIKTIPFDNTTGMVDIKALEHLCTDEVAGMYVEHPNAFGVFETQLPDIKQISETYQSLLVIGIHPLSLGIIEPPGSVGADIVIGEGRSLGNPMDLGGSTLGIFACKQQFLRQLPGRVIGMTQDSNGKSAYCMTLQTREQHIRRGRATSNICTNEGLCTLAALVYLSWLGPQGLSTLGNINVETAYHLEKQLAELPGFTSRFSGPHFNEFTMSYDGNIDELQEFLLSKGWQGGLALKNWYPAMQKEVVFGVSELVTNEHITEFIALLKEVA